VKHVLGFPRVGPCRMACRALAAAYRAERDHGRSGPQQSRYEWLYEKLNDDEKARVARFQERIERLKERR
jgi:hypothetical protein